MKKKRIKGITLIEITIVLIILGILALFTFPNIPQMRQKAEQKACIGNLWLIKMAKDQWALDENKITGDTVGWDDIAPVDGSGYLDRKPVCPTTKTSNSYTLNDVWQNPTCSETGHAIE